MDVIISSSCSQIFAGYHSGNSKLTLTSITQKSIQFTHAAKNFRYQIHQEKEIEKQYSQSTA